VVVFQRYSALWNEGKVFGLLAGWGASEFEKKWPHTCSETWVRFCHRCSRGSEQGIGSARIGTAEGREALTGLDRIEGTTVFSFVVFERSCQLTERIRLLWRLLAERGRGST